MHLKINDRIEFSWPHGGKVPGTVVNIKRGKFVVKWDDGKQTVTKKEWLVENCKVKC